MTSHFSYVNSVPSSWKQVVSKYSALPEPEKSFITYVWVDGTREWLRSKTRAVHKRPKTLNDIPEWGFCGFGTYMTETNKDSQRVLIPRAMYDDPFFHDSKRKNKLVLCDTYEYDTDFNKVPTINNTRFLCNQLMEKVKDTEPWFGIEQEYTLVDLDGHPLGWPKGGFPRPMGPYYCSVGAGLAIGRDVVESHLRACHHANLNICAINSEAMPAQWEFCTGPTEGIHAADELWMARYILIRVAEDFGVQVSFDPKIINIGEWSGSGAHCNFSTKAMREDNGIRDIEQAIKKLEVKHAEHIKKYDPKAGADNMRRLTGKCETASIDRFDHGIEDRNVAVRIPIDVHLAKKGYFEDRRPAANCDPYDVTGVLVETCLLN